jgi:hypothetical protein
VSDTSVSAEIVVLEASPEEVLIVTIAERGADGASDHGLLSGLADDDHLQYHNDARGDARYAAIAKGVTNGDSHNHDGGDGAQIAYASLSGLPTLGTAAAAATGDFEAAGAVSTHNAVATAHGISAWGATLVDDTSATVARATLGLGTAATTASTAYATSTQGANADSHASNTSNPHAVSKTQVGLGSVDNTSDASKPVSTAQQTALNLKANLASPTFTGTVVGITAAMVGAPSGSGNSTGTNTGNETATTIGALLNSATIKTTPVDADHIGLMDSAASNIWKKLSWANLKTMLLGGSPITDFFKHGSVVMNTNPFGGRKLFINSINNALFRAETRWVVTGNLFLTADDSLISAISPTELAKLFDGTSESFLTVPVGNYAVINISFSTEPAGLYPNYPYGTFYLSYYNNGYPSGTSASTVSVYSTYAPHGIGWHSANFGTFFSGTNQKIDSAYLNKYGISQVELKIYAPDSGIATMLSQLDLDLDRPSVNEMPLVDKFRANKLYAKLSTETLTPRVAGTYDLGESGTPYRRLFLRNTTEQLRVEYDAANYLGSTTNSAGVTTFNLVGTAPAAKWAVSNATTNAIYDVATFSKNSTGAGAAGLGARIVLAAKSSTTVDTPQAGISSEWVNATHATRTSRLKLSY